MNCPILKIQHAFILPLVLASCSAVAAVNDLYPTDYVSLPPGMTTVTAYSYYRQAEDNYAQGRKQLDGNLDIPIAALRYVRFMKLGQFTVSPIAVVSWQGITASPDSLSDRLGENAHGVGDLRLGAALWLKDDPSTHEYLSVMATVLAPTGDYNKNNLLNIGENRWRFVLGAGWIKPLSERVILEVIPEIAWYGENDNYFGQNKLEQDPSYALEAYLRYDFSPKFEVFSGAQVNRGGATSINSVDQHNPPENTRVSLGMTYLTDSAQWMFRYSRDVEIENGFKTKGELVLRYLIWF